MTSSNTLPDASSMADFFSKSRPEFWLANIQNQKMMQRLGADPLPQLLRQQIATYVSRLNECVYCTSSHACDVEILGGDVDAIEQAVCNLNTAQLDDKTRELFRFVRTLVSSSGLFGKADWSQALDAGWRSDELESAVYVAAWFQFMNTIATGNLIPATDKETALELARSRQRPERYEALVKSLEEQIGKTVRLTIEDRHD